MTIPMRNDSEHGSDTYVTQMHYDKYLGFEKNEKEGMAKAM